MAIRVQVSGLRELDKSLGELTKGQAKGVLKRVLLKAGQPIADAAQALAPRDTGKLGDSIKVSTKVENKAGKKEFAEAMKAGLGADAALGALRSARREAKGEASFAVAEVGPQKPKTKRDGIKMWVQEVGSKTQPGKPYMRPAWDSEQNRALGIIKDELGDEIKKTVARAAKRRASKLLKASQL